jgi:hypothetical protein
MLAFFFIEDRIGVKQNNPQFASRVVLYLRKNYFFLAAFLAAFLGAAFLVAFLAAFLGAAFLAAFLGAAFLAAFFGAAFLAAFFGAAFFVAFLAAFFAAFLGAAFLVVAILKLLNWLSCKLTIVMNKYQTCTYKVINNENVRNC